MSTLSPSAHAVVLSEPGRFEARTLPLPEIGDDDGLLRVDACGLCGTDHEQYSGALPAPYPFVPGHETVGTVVALGDGARRRWGVNVGDRVAVEVFLSCRECAACRSGNYRRCAHHGLRDMYGGVTVDAAPGLWGGYADHQYLAPDSLLLPVPPSLDPTVATLFNPLGAGIRWGVTVPGTKAGDVVAVLGPGVRGLAAAVAAKEAGAAFVMVTGFGPRDAERLAWAARFGADLAVDVAVDDPVAALRKAAGARADVVVDVTARAPSAFLQAIDLATTGGTIVVAGTRGTGVTVPVPPDAVVFKELHIIGALGVDAPAYRAALDLLASGRYPFEELPRRVVTLDGAPNLVRAMAGEGEGPPPIHAVIAP